MNREQKAATIEALAGEIEGSEAVFAVDYRGISVPQAAELRAKLRDADATFRVVKNSLTERAADRVGAESLKPLLTGPTALTFVRGDAALAAKAIADQGRATQLLPFKGGLMNGDVLDADQIRAISRLPSREVLYGQLVGVVASPLSGLVRTLGSLVGGLAVALSQVREKMESGEIPAGGPPAAESPPAEDASMEEAPAGDAPAEGAPADDASVEDAHAGDAPAGDAPAEATGDAPAGDAPAEATGEETPAEGASTEGASAEGAEESAEESAGEGAAEDPPAAHSQADPAPEPAKDDNHTDAPAQEQAESAEATKED
jgi:large subunit ribosomal protein L10